MGKTEVDGGRIFHWSLSLSAEDGQLTEEHCGAIANDFIKDLDFTEFS